MTYSPNRIEWFPKGGDTINEIVKYDNKVNSLSLSGFSAVELNLFMMLCAETKGKGSELVTIGYEDIKRALGLERQTNKYLHKELYRMSDKLSKVRCNFADSTRFVVFNLFSTFTGDLKTGTLDIRVNVDFQGLLNEITKNFTLFELSEFVKLESKYSKNLYRLLKQYRTTGTYRVEAARFRELMDCPASYQNKEFMRDCVNKAVAELSTYFEGLKVEPIKSNKRGNPITAYEFTFTPKKAPDEQKQLEGGADPGHQEPQKRRGRPRKNSFNNFSQREYDYTELEKQLLRGQADPADEPAEKPKRRGRKKKEQ